MLNGSPAVAGTKIDPNNKAVHGGLIFLGLYSLLISIFGCVRPSAFLRFQYTAAQR